MSFISYRARMSLLIIKIELVSLISTKLALHKLTTSLLSYEDKDTINVLVRFFTIAYKIRNGQSCEKHLINPSFCFYCDGQITLLYCQSKVFLIQYHWSLNPFIVCLLMHVVVVL